MKEEIMLNNEVNPMSDAVIQFATKELEGILTPLKQWIYSTFTYKYELDYLKRKKEQKYFYQGLRIWKMNLKKLGLNQ